MPRFSDDQLRDKALYALEEAYEQCVDGPVKGTKALRFTLAYLANRTDDRACFDEFWRAVTDPMTGENPMIVGGLRRSRAAGPLLRIYGAFGLRREG